jgi:thiol-disulfide isomerase/thioredoxin
MVKHCGNARSSCLFWTLPTALGAECGLLVTFQSSKCGDCLDDRPHVHCFKTAFTTKMVVIALNGRLFLSVIHNMSEPAFLLPAVIPRNTYRPYKEPQLRTEIGKNLK